MGEAGDYSTEFYKSILSGSINSANVIVPIIVDAVNPNSVIDVGCGTGAWLSVFQRYGVAISGIDKFSGDKTLFQINEQFFKNVDLEQEISINQKYDLVVSLEVAEHLSPNRANSFVRDLTQLSKVIVFSAAIPLQGGTNHLNERWQNYWVEIFTAHSYVPIDYIRPRIWTNPNVEWWYRQNILVFCQKDDIVKYPRLNEYLHAAAPYQAWDLVHPELYKAKTGIVD